MAKWEHSGNTMMEARMFSEFFAIFSRSRHELVKDAAGVAVLFATLIGTLSLAG